MADRKTLILLVRHGVTTTTGKVLPGRAKGLHLSEAGQAQAEQAAMRIAGIAGNAKAADDNKDSADNKDSGTSRSTKAGRSKKSRTAEDGSATAAKGIAAVYASPLERTRETAKPISKALGLRTRTSKGLLECDFGDWTGRELNELRKTDEWADVQGRPAGFRFPGGESFLEMQNRIWTELLRLADEHHDSTIVAVSHADPIKAAVAMAAGVHIDLFQRLVISPCSVTPILITGGGPIILAVNSTGDDLSRLVPS